MGSQCMHAPTSASMGFLLSEVIHAVATLAVTCLTHRIVPAFPSFMNRVILPNAVMAFWIPERNVRWVP